MELNKLKCLDILLKTISNDLKINHSYKIVCEYKDSLVTLDFVNTFKWQDEFYCAEPKTISNSSEDQHRLFTESDSYYSTSKNSFKFKKLMKHYENKETEHLFLYLLENQKFYDFDISCSNFVYNVESLERNWMLPILKLDNDLEFISLHLIEHEQN